MVPGGDRLTEPILPDKHLVATTPSCIWVSMQPLEPKEDRLETVKSPPHGHVGNTPREDGPLPTSPPLIPRYPAGKYIWYHTFQAQPEPIPTLSEVVCM
jgi:hypothetical protein